MTPEQFDALVELDLRAELWARIDQDDHCARGGISPALLAVFGYGDDVVSCIAGYARAAADILETMILAERREVWIDESEDTADALWRERQRLLAGRPGRFLVWHVDDDGERRHWFCMDGHLDEKFAIRQYVVQPDEQGYFPTYDAAVYAAERSVMDRIPVVTEGEISEDDRFAFAKPDDWEPVGIVYRGERR